MWKDKYFIISLIVFIMQFINFVFCILFALEMTTIIFAGLGLLFVTFVLCKIAYDLHTEGWEEL